jgi:hypothetical protein
MTPSVDENGNAPAIAPAEAVTTEESYWRLCNCVESDSVQIHAERLLWGTYGKPLVEGDLGPGPLRWVRLRDCSNEHLKAILRTQKQAEQYIIRAIIWILTARGHNPWGDLRTRIA